MKVPVRVRMGGVQLDSILHLDVLLSIERQYAIKVNIAQPEKLGSWYMY